LYSHISTFSTSGPVPSWCRY